MRKDDNATQETNSSLYQAELGRMMEKIADFSAEMGRSRKRLEKYLLAALREQGIEPERICQKCPVTYKCPSRDLHD